MQKEPTLKALLREKGLLNEVIVAYSTTRRDSHGSGGSGEKGLLNDVIVVDL